MSTETPTEVLTRWSPRTAREREFDHVMVGAFDGAPAPSPLEVEARQFLSISDIGTELRLEPQVFTPWFAPSLEIAAAQLQSVAHQKEDRFDTCTRIT